MKIIKTSEVVTIEDYPYGFKLRCTLLDSVDFDQKKGYRHVTQTTDPKSGRLNNPKKGTYYTAMFRYYNTDGHIKIIGFDFNGRESINKGTAFLFDHFDSLTPEEVKYLYSTCLVYSLSDCKSSVIYCGSEPDAIKVLYKEFWTTCKKGLTDGLNYFDSLLLDIEAIKATQIPDYNPWVITESIPIKIT